MPTCLRQRKQRRSLCGKQRLLGEVTVERKVRLPACRSLPTCSTRFLSHSSSVVRPASEEQAVCASAVPPLLRVHMPSLHLFALLTRSLYPLSFSCSIGRYSGIPATPQYQAVAIFSSSQFPALTLQAAAQCGKDARLQDKIGDERFERGQLPNAVRPHRKCHLASHGVFSLA